MGGYRLFKYANMRAQTPNRDIRHITICSFVMYPVYQENHHMFLLGVIAYTRDYEPSFNTPRFSPINLEPKSFMEIVQYKVNSI